MAIEGHCPLCGAMYLERYGAYLCGYPLADCPMMGEELDRCPKHGETLDPRDPICGGCENEADAATEGSAAARWENAAMAKY